MDEIRASILIARSTHAVWAFMTDLRNMPRWDPDVLEATQTSAGPMGIGTEVRGALGLLGRRLTLTARVSDYEPQRRIAIVYTSSLLKGTRATFAMEPVNGKTVLKRVLELHVSGPLKVLRPLLLAAAKAQREAEIKNVKGILESPEVE